MLYLGLEQSGQLGGKDLRRIFVNVDITPAEMEHGLTAYDQLEERLGRLLIQIKTC